MEKAFPPIEGTDRKFFVESSGQVPDRPLITFVIASPEQSADDNPDMRKRLQRITMECGPTSRTFKSALFWLVPETSVQMREDVRRLLAWQDIEAEGLELDAAQEKQPRENIDRARRDVRLAICRGYRTVLFLGKEGTDNGVARPGTVHDRISGT